MLFDPRLWQFTYGVRLRIAGAVTMGIASSLVGIGRLALLGWLLASVLTGETFTDLIVPLAAVAAVMVLRGWLEHTRVMIAHRTAIRVQLALRKRLYAKVVALGPAHFGLERTGAVMISMIDGVEQLETYFGRYLPQLVVAGGRAARRLCGAGVPRPARCRADVRLRHVHAVRAGVAAAP